VRGRPRPRLSSRLPLGLGLGVARSVGQRFNSRSGPPYVAAEAVGEALIPARTIKPRQTRFCPDGSHDLNGGRLTVIDVALKFALALDHLATVLVRLLRDGKRFHRGLDVRSALLNVPAIAARMNRTATHYKFIRRRATHRAILPRNSC
jgi:hypothetical protein